MDMTGEQRLAASCEAVYAALNDTEILRQAIPGCEEIEKLSDTEMTAKVVAKVGPVKAKFQGHVTLSDLQPPESYTISGEGKGGAAGFAKGSAKVSLQEDGDGTLLSYQVHADIGGKLAQLGGRLIDSTAKKMADEFFKSFGALVEAAAAPAEQAEAPAAATGETPAPAAAPAPATMEQGGRPNWLLIGLGAAAVLLMIWLLATV